MEPVSNIGIAKCLLCGNEWRTSSKKKRHKCPICGKYQAHLMPLDETHPSNDTPKSGEVITKSSEVLSNSANTTLKAQDIDREVMVQTDDTTTESGTEHIQGNLTYLGWALFLIGILSVGWYLWRSMNTKKDSYPFSSANDVWI
jgi:predicted  nucleic acid-binding Zn-ribbon protein